MNRAAHEVQTRWLESRQPEDRTSNERMSVGRTVFGWIKGLSVHLPGFEFVFIHNPLSSCR